MLSQVYLGNAILTIGEHSEESHTEAGSLFITEQQSETVRVHRECKLKSYLELFQRTCENSKDFKLSKYKRDVVETMRGEKKSNEYHCELHVLFRANKVSRYGKDLFISS